MKKQTVKRFNINLTEKELEALAEIEKYYRLNKIDGNTSDCIRDAITAYGRKAKIAICTGTDIN